MSIFNQEQYVIMAAGSLFLAKKDRLPRGRDLAGKFSCF